LLDHQNNYVIIMIASTVKTFLLHCSLLLERPT